VVARRQTRTIGAGVTGGAAVRAGNASGFYGDRPAAFRKLLEAGDVDVITGDYLAELTMLILARDKVKTFVTGVPNADAVLMVARTQHAGTGQLRPAMFLLPRQTPGFSNHPIEMDIAETERQCQLFLDDVRLPADALPGLAQVLLKTEGLPCQNRSCAAWQATAS
jgi:alkylation response protein AidB-like acyl-CoA dehydrogenase